MQSPRQEVAVKERPAGGSPGGSLRGSMDGKPTLQPLPPMGSLVGPTRDKRSPRRVIVSGHFEDV